MKKTLCVILTFILLSMAVTVMASQEQQEIIVTLDGDKLQFEQQPIVQNGRVLVPMRTIFEAMGATVAWDAPTKTVVGIKDSTNIKMKIGNKELIKNGQTMLLDVPPQIVNNRTLVPIRAVAESFDANVSWDANRKTVIINTSKSSVPDLSTGEIPYTYLESELQVLLGEDYEYFKKCMFSTASQYDEQSQVLVITGNYPDLYTDMRGIVSLDKNGQINIAFLRGDNIEYYANSTNVNINYMFNNWLNEFKDRPLISHNRTNTSYSGEYKTESSIIHINDMGSDWIGIYGESFWGMHSGVIDNVDSLSNGSLYRAYDTLFYKINYDSNGDSENDFITLYFLNNNQVLALESPNGAFGGLNVSFDGLYTRSY